jgi:hypothetical protein
VANYIVICHCLEMPYGHSFSTVPKFPYDIGEHALFSLVGFPGGEILIPGRYYTDDDGSGWIQLPGRRIDIPQEIRVEVVGLVVESEPQPCLN